MIETKAFSHDLIYEKIEDFCDLHGITEETFKYSSPAYVNESTFVDNLKSKVLIAFRVGKFHPLNKEISAYLVDNYSFVSKLKTIIEQYDCFFNTTNNSHDKIKRPCYTISNAYLIDCDNTLRGVTIFIFEDLVFRNPYTLVVEVNDSDILELEQAVFEYYKTMFKLDNIPEELHKPLSQLTDDEQKLLSMVLI